MRKLASLSVILALCGGAFYAVSAAEKAAEPAKEAAAAKTPLECFESRKGASEIKKLVGGDPLSPEGKGSNGDFAMFGTFNMVMTCNSRLRVRLDGDAGQRWLRERVQRAAARAV